MGKSLVSCFLTHGVEQDKYNTTVRVTLSLHAVRADVTCVTAAHCRLLSVCVCVCVWQA